MKLIESTRSRILLFLTVGPLFGWVLFVSAIHTSPEHWTRPRIFHEPFDQEFESQIVLSRTAVSADDVPKKIIPSGNGAYWFGVHYPDRTQSQGDPWNTRIMVYNERGYLVQLELKRIHYCRDIEWINEKLLKVRVWWGRVVATDLILDVEKEKFVYQEMVHGGSIPFQQYQEAKEKGFTPDK
jgi:hypothetical protein